VLRTSFCCCLFLLAALRSPRRQGRPNRHWLLSRRAQEPRQAPRPSRLVRPPAATVGSSTSTCSCPSRGQRPSGRSAGRQTSGRLVLSPRPSRERRSSSSRFSVISLACLPRLRSRRPLRPAAVDPRRPRHRTPEQPRRFRPPDEQSQRSASSRSPKPAWLLPRSAPMRTSRLRASSHSTWR
jgi:hypothetical protein